MALKHFTRVPGPGGHLLVDDDGHEFKPYTAYLRALDRKAVRASTKDRYTSAVARFLDFLTEFRALGTAATADHIADVIDAYPLFLRDGATPRVWSEAVPREMQVAYATSVGLPIGLAYGSIVPVVAAINFFLQVAKDEANKVLHALRAAGLDPAWEDLASVFRTVDGSEQWGWRQKQAFKQHSLVGAVVRVRPELERPRGLRNPIKGGVQIDLVDREFPLDRIADLLAQATSYRDKAYWACLAAGGLRPTEPLNILISDIDAAAGKLWVIDPEMRRFGREMPDSSRLRFKGRTMSAVYLWEPLKSAFWDALKDYLRYEFIPSDRDAHLFQRLDARGRGLPLNTVSYTALEKSFKKAVVRAGVPGLAGRGKTNIFRLFASAEAWKWRFWRPFLSEWSAFSRSETPGAAVEAESGHDYAAASSLGRRIRL